MKSKHLLLLTAFITLTALMFNYTAGESKITPKEKIRLKKPDWTAHSIFVGYNNWKYVMRNNGSYMYDAPDLDGNANNGGGEFPRGSNRTIVYAAGFYIGALKNGLPVVSEAEFGSEFQPGRITNSNVPFRQLTAESPESSNRRVYIIDKDFGGDWTNWPGDHKTNGDPALIADVQTWAVFNDLDTTLSQESVLNSPLPGLGLQVTLESFASDNMLSSDAVFFRLTVDNKTDMDYDSTFIGLWMDADVNNSSNDIPGTDSLSNLVFMYNADNEVYDAAVGIILLQGPVVQIVDVDPFLASKYAGNVKKIQFDSIDGYYSLNDLPAGKIWLGTTSSWAYAGGTDARNNMDRYFYLSGRNRTTGQLNNNAYVFPGDPLTQQGSPYVANVSDPADWRFVSNCGPVILRAGDKQEIWYAVAGGEGVDRLGAFATMRQKALLTKTSFRASIASFVEPASPAVEVQPYEDKIVLTWNNAAEFSEDPFGERAGITKAEGYSDDYIKYDFQGYRVYRSLTGLFTDPPIAQFDKIDTFGTVYNRRIGEGGQMVIDEIHLGDNTGLQHMYVDSDVTLGKKYYYAVTAYDAQPYIGGPDSMPFDGHYVLAPMGIPVTQETDRFENVHSAVPYRNPSALSNAQTDSARAEHITGPGDGYIEMKVVNPDLVQSKTYTIEFFTIPDDSNGAPLVGYEFLPADLLAYRFLADDLVQPIGTRADDPRTYYDVNLNGRYDVAADYPLNDAYFAFEKKFLDQNGNVINKKSPSLTLDGIEISLYEKEKGFANFEVTRNQSGPLDPVQAGALNALGFPTPDNSNPEVGQQSTNSSRWALHTAEIGVYTYSDFVVRSVNAFGGFDSLIPYDYEIRFTAAGGKAGLRGQAANMNVPFEIWNTTLGLRLIPYVIDDNANGIYDFSTNGGVIQDHFLSGGSNDPFTERIYILNPADRSAGSTGYNAWVTGGALGDYPASVGTEILGRIGFVNWNGGDVTGGVFNALMPEEGTVFRIETNTPLSSYDRFVFAATANHTYTKKEGRHSLENIKAVPNPFYIRSEYQSDSYEKIMKFINLPPVCTIKIFTVAGDLVRMLRHNGTSNNERTDPIIRDLEGDMLRNEETSIEVWDLKTANFRYVASGMYIALVESPYGKKFVKFAVIQ